MKKAEATRLLILEKAFELIYSHGYQTTSIDDILATTNVTKGAFYYNFKNKDDMGLAIINEILKPTLSKGLIEPLQHTEDPIGAIYDMIHHLLMENEFMKVEYGCPAANLTQEMTPWKTEFSNALNELTNECLNTMAASLEKGKKAGNVKKNVYGRQVALLVMSGYWGIRNIGKLENNKKAYLSYLKELKRYLDTLR